MNSPQRFLVAGHTGSGKTTLFTTLPGRKFMYIFDPNALASIEGQDIDYELFNVETDDIDISVKTLKSGVGDSSSRRIEPKTYRDWEKHFEAHYDVGFFDDYDWIGLDSFTTFQQIVMDRVQYLNNRLGKQPEQADWSAQMICMGNIFRSLSGSRGGLYCTAHIETRQDDTTKKTFNRFLMTGQLRVRIPLLFNNVVIAHSDCDEKTIAYSIQTRPDRDHPIIRTNLKGLEMYEDVTVADFDHADDYGLGRILRKCGKVK